MNHIYKYLILAQSAYHKGEPFISDTEFDHLADKYNFYELGTEPTGKTGKHLSPMYSLQKVYKGEDKCPISKSVSTVCTSKLDGSAISLRYIDGHLMQVLTRGNGIEGEDITHLFVHSEIVPNYAFPACSEIQITGEIVASKDIENSRNYAAGALHLKDVEEFRTRNLTFIAYGVFPFLNFTYTADMQRLKLAGFNTVIESDWNQFPQDGTVFRIDNNNDFLDAGHTAKHPRGAFALKNRADVAVEETTLRQVDWQIGKGGKVTPVAIFDEVIIEDASIIRATLHNAGFVEELDLHIGDTLLITRAGGVIPKVVGKL